MQKFPVLKQLVLASAIALSIAACSDTGNQRDMSKDEVQFLTHLDQARFYQKQGQLKASIEEAQNALKLDPISQDPLLIVADNLLIAGDARSAERQYRKLLEPEDPSRTLESGNLYNRAVLGLASALTMQKKLSEAGDLLKTLKSPSKSDQAEAFLLEGDIAVADGKREKAQEFYQKAREQNAENVKSLVALSRLAASAGDQDKASKLMDEAESVDANSSELWLWKAQYADSQKQYAEAEEAYIKALDEIGRYDLMTYRKFQTISRLVSVLRQQGKISEAFVYEEILAKSAPGAIKTGYETALKLYKEGKLSEAAAELEKVLRQAPGHSDSGVLLGMIRYAQGDLQSAEEYLSRYSGENTAPAVSKILAATKIKLQQPGAATEILKQLDNQEQDPEILSLLGIASLASGDTSEGLEQIKQSLALNPDNVELRSRLARYYISIQQTDNAIAELKQVLKQAPDNVTAKTLMTSAYVRAGDTKQAEAFAKAWLKNEPKSAPALNALGSIAVQAGNEAAARDYFLQASKAQPDNATPLLNLAQLDLRAQDWAAAQAQYAAVLAINPEHTPSLNGFLNTIEKQQGSAAAIAALDKLAEQYPRAINIRLALAELAAAEGKTNQAEGYLATVETLAPGDSRVQRVRPGIYRTAVEKELSQENFKGAREIVGNALRTNPQSVELALLAARVDLLSGKADEGLALLNQIKQQYPTSPAPLEMEGDYYASVKSFDKAVEAYRAAWDQQYTQSLAIKMHQALRQSNQAKASLEPLKDWLNIQPNSPQTMTLLAMGYQADGQNAKAIEQYEKIRAVRPNDAVALNNLAWLYQETGNAAAELTAKTAFDLTPDNAAIADTYGWILLQKNKVKESIAVLEKAHQLDPSQTEIAQHLAEAYDKAGDTEKAQKLRTSLSN